MSGRDSIRSSLVYTSLKRLFILQKPRLVLVPRPRLQSLQGPHGPHSEVSSKVIPAFLMSANSGSTESYKNSHTNLKGTLLSLDGLSKNHLTANSEVTGARTVCLYFSQSAKVPFTVVFARSYS